MKTFIGNWKLHSDKKTAEEFVKNYVKSENDVYVCPPSTYFYMFEDLIKQKKINLGAQWIFNSNEESSTGLVNANILKEFDINIVIIGHSEERVNFKLSDEDINKKILYSLENELQTVVCIGEGLLDRKQNMQYEVVEEQIKKALESVRNIDSQKIIIAYEPIWSIGSKNAADRDDIINMASFLRKKLDEMSFKKTKIIYGGSVNSTNSKSITDVPNIDGLLIGRASVNLEEFSKITSV